MPTITFRQEKVKALREALGYTQDEFGKLIGVTKQAISLWEAGTVAPNLDSLVKIASATGAKIESFFVEDRS
jgi:DNA-binding XRE family transcriptional regulator